MYTRQSLGGQKQLRAGTHVEYELIGESDVLEMGDKGVNPENARLWLEQLAAAAAW